MSKAKYPGLKEAEQERIRSGSVPREDEPEWIADAPNYDAFPGWTPEEVLVWLNID